MNQELLKEKIKRGLTIQTISDEFKCSKGNVRHWMKKYKLKTFRATNKALIQVGPRVCPRCKVEKPRDNFYSRRNKKGSSCYCKPCSNSQAIERQQAFKVKCSNYKGGKCEYCNYDTYVGALEFHHKDPSGKDFTISKIKSHKFDDVIIAELDKCLLLCSNCHKEEHARLRGLI